MLAVVFPGVTDNMNSLKTLKRCEAQDGISGVSCVQSKDAHSTSDEVATTPHSQYSDLVLFESESNSWWAQVPQQNLNVWFRGCTRFRSYGILPALQWPK